MTNETSSPSTDLWAEQWAIQAAVKADALERRMLVAAAGRTLTPRQQAAMDAMTELLRSARHAARRPRRRSGTQRLRGARDRWRGTSVEQAYQNLHAAEIFPVELLSDSQVEALVPKVAARADPILERDDPRRELLRRVQQARPGRPDRTAVQQTMEIAYDASDQMHVRVRDFRNILVLSAFLIAVLMGLLTWVVAHNPGAMPLCFDPRSTTAASPGGAMVCPGGNGRSPGSADVLIVAGLGLLGGALAAAFAIRNVRGTSTPYGVPMALAFLKVPSGALTAAAGLLLLGGDFVPGLSQLDSQRQILAYALVFGYAQQVATRLIDTRAQSILNSVPSKDSEAKQHPLTTPGTAGPGRGRVRARTSLLRRTGWRRTS